MLRVILGCTMWSLTAVVRLPLLGDALEYEAMGASVAADWLAGKQSLWLHNAMAGGRQAWLIVAIIGGFYFILGGLRAVPLLIAAYAAITSFTPVLTYKLTDKLGGSRRAARFAAGLVVFSPCFVFWSGALYKEGIILLALNLAIWQIVKLIEGWNVNALVVLVLCIASLVGLRFYLAIMLAPFALLTFLLARTRSRLIGSYVMLLTRQSLIAGGFVLLLIATGVAGRLMETMPDDTAGIFATIQNSRADLAQSNSGYLPNADISSPAKAARFLPVGVAYFLSVPLPWHIGSARQNVTIPETLFWLCLYPFVFSGVLIARRSHGRAATIIFGFTILVSLFYGLFLGNIGAAYRMRIQVWVFWAIFAGIGWDAWRLGRSRHQPTPRVQP